MKEQGFLTISVVIVVLLVSYLLEKTGDDILTLIQLKQREKYIHKARMRELSELLEDEVPQTSLRSTTMVQNVEIRTSVHYALPPAHSPLYNLEKLYSAEESCPVRLTPLPSSPSSHLLGFISGRTCVISQLNTTKNLRTKGNIEIQDLTLDRSTIVATGKITIGQLTVSTGPILLISGGSISIHKLHATDSDIALISLTGEISIDSLSGNPQIYSDALLEKSIPPHSILSQAEFVPLSKGWIEGIDYGN